MTTPNQPVDNFLAMLGYGAFQVADPKAGQPPAGNYGQNVTDSLVKSLVKGNLPKMGSGIKGVNTGIAHIKDQLNSMSMDSISMLDGIIPGLPSSAFNTKQGAVDSITSSMNVNPTAQTDTTVRQIADTLGGADVEPDNDAVAAVKGYRNQVQKQHQGLVSQLFGGLKRKTASNDETVSAADVGNAAATTTTTADSAQFMGEWNSAILAVRNNKSIMSGIDETEESNFSITDLFSGGADPVATISATASSVPVAYWRAEEYAKKGFISWFGKGFTNVTGLYIDIYRANYTSNTWDLLHTSENLVSRVGSSWSYLVYTIPEANRLDTNAGDVLGVAWRVVGTGTHSIGGKNAGSWLTDHPTAVAPKRPASTRTGSGTLAFSSTTYSNNVPWFGIGIVTGDAQPAFLAPRQEVFDIPGPFEYTIPEQFRVAGMIIDRVAVGGGGGGSGALTGLGKGGAAGVWAADSLVYGTDIPLGTTTLTGVVGSRGNGGLSASDATASTAAGTGVVELSAAGGLTGGSESKDGESPGDFVWNDNPYAGGLSQTRNGGRGNGPGGGGAAGGLLVASGHGAPGAVFFTARQS